MEIIELKNRSIIDIPPIDPQGIIRHFGVSLTTSEAQNFIAKDYRVFGDEDGPFLVIRLKAGQNWPFVMDKEDVDVRFSPIPWEVAGHSGVICWMESII